MRYERVIGMLRQMIGRRGRAYLVWDFMLVGPRPLSKLGIDEERPLIGVYTASSVTEQIAADIESMRTELGVRAYPPRAPHKPRRTAE